MSRNTKRLAIVLLITVLFLLDGIMLAQFFTKDNSSGYTTAKVGLNTYEEKGIKEENTLQEVKEHDSDNLKNKENAEVEAAKKQAEARIEEKKKSAVTSRSGAVTVPAQEEVAVQKTVSQSAVLSNYQGHETVGKIEIPKTGVDLYILKSQTVKGMEIASCLVYSSGKLNQPGRNLIQGHNFRNGKLFSNNAKLNIGDKIYITSLDGERAEYTIYNKMIVSPEECSFLEKDATMPEIVLSSCTDDEKKRVVIIARAN